MVNTANMAIAQAQTPGGKVNYEGEARIDGVPGTAARAARLSGYGRFQLWCFVADRSSVMRLMVCR